MKVLLCSTLYHPNFLGGAERSVQLLAEALARRGLEVVVVTLGRERARKTGEVHGVRVHYLPVRNFYWPFAQPTPGIARKALWHGLDTYNPWMAASVGEVLDEEGPDVVNTHTIAGFSAAVWRAVKMRGLPLVHTLHDQYLLCPRSSMFKNGRDCRTQCVECRVYAWPRKRATALVDVVTGVSRFILDRHLRCGYFPVARQAVIYNAYKLPAPVWREAPAGAHPGPLRIGYLGRLHPTKGVDRLVRAFLSLERGVAELWIAGSGKPEDEAAFKALARDRRAGGAAVRRGRPRGAIAVARYGTSSGSRGARVRRPRRGLRPWRHSGAGARRRRVALRPQRSGGAGDAPAPLCGTPGEACGDGGRGEGAREAVQPGGVRAGVFGGLRQGHRGGAEVGRALLGRHVARGARVKLFGRLGEASGFLALRWADLGFKVDMRIAVSQVLNPLGFELR